MVAHPEWRLCRAYRRRALGLFSGLDPRSAQFTIASDFLVVGVVEEGAKYWLMSRKTWDSPSFNCRFDGVVYAVFTSLGFAGMENIMYGLNYGTGVFLTRALMAIPAHMGFAVLFGIFYGWSAACVVVGYALSVFLHGLYDSAAMVSSSASDSLFFLAVVVIYVVNFVVARQAAKHDKRFAY